MLLRDFVSRDDVLDWIHAARDCDVTREVIVGYDAHGVPVVTHKIELTNATRANVYDGRDVVSLRTRGGVTAMRSYAQARCMDVHTPFVVDWTIHLTPSGGCCCGESKTKPCKRTPKVTDLKLERLEGWQP